MQELIKIKNIEFNGKIVKMVSARDLHIALRSRQHFTKFIELKIKHLNFKENIDFMTIKRKDFVPTSNGNIVEYFLTIENAKKICRISLKTPETDKVYEYLSNINEEKKDDNLMSDENKIKILININKKLSKSYNNILFEDFINIMQQEFNMNEKEIFDILKNNNILKSDGMPNKLFVDMEFFAVDKKIFSTPYGEKILINIYVTGAGQIYIYEKIKNNMQKNIIPTIKNDLLNTYF